ncbi:MAG: hypothetical protein JXN62_13425 [Bacteroidales bacterium]|nr:hypothetical protein [Bacteroidales bacterium]
MIKKKLRSLSERGWYLFIRTLSGISRISFPVPGKNDVSFSLVHDKLKRKFILHKPASNDKSSKLPLVIVLHGRGVSARSMIFLTRNGFNKLADKDGFTVIYPDGIGQNWNDGRMDEETDDRAHKENIDDVGFISELIDYMITDHNTDQKRVYVTGISNGAIMSYRLACELSHKIAAIAPVDGNIPYLLLPDCKPSYPVSVLAINNSDDPLVPYNGGDIYGHFHRVKLGKVLSVDESIQFWVKVNKCSVIPVKAEEPDKDPADGTRVEKKLYRNGIDGSEVVLYTVEGGGHTWPGGFQYLPVWMIGKTSRDIDACEIIWSFFRKHTK